MIIAKYHCKKANIKINNHYRVPVKSSVLVSIQYLIVRYLYFQLTDIFVTYTNLRVCWHNIMYSMIPGIHIIVSFYHSLEIDKIVLTNILIYF